MIPIYRLISRLANKQRREFETLSFPQKYTAAQARALHFLLNNMENPICQRDIEEEFGLRPPSASSIIKTMEEKGLIVRISSNKDARVKYIHLTDRALQYQTEIDENMQSLEEQIIGDISQEDLAIWEKVSLKLINNLEMNKRGGKKL